MNSKLKKDQVQENINRKAHLPKQRQEKPTFMKTTFKKNVGLNQLQTLACMTDIFSLSHLIYKMLTLEIHINSSQRKDRLQDNTKLMVQMVKLSLRQEPLTSKNQHTHTEDPKSIVQNQAHMMAI